MRKTYTSAFKAQVVLEMLREERSVSQIAAAHGVHPNQLHRWKTQALKQLPHVFDAPVTPTRDDQAQAQLDGLYAEIGRLTTQLNWLKKKSGLDTPAC